MAITDTVAALAAFKRRGAGTDGERRAALWLAGELRTPNRDVATETFWCRPNWALAQAWHVALALGGSLLAVDSPTIGGVILVIALVSLVSDAFTGVSPGRRLTPERASQNVVSHAAADPQPAIVGTGRNAGDPGPVRLILTANYDAGRMGLVYRPAARRLAARLRRMAGDGALTPGWLGWLAITLVGLIVVATLRRGGATGTTIGVLQLLPTAALVVALALLLELAGAQFGPGAGDNASGVGVALALTRALDVAPPRRLTVELVLQGAGDGGMIGLRRYLRRRRHELAPAHAIVLGIAPCAAGTPRWWISDGSLVPVRHSRRLAGFVDRVAGPSTGLGALPHRGRGVTPALPARFAGLPSLTIGCLDGAGLAPRSHQPDDLPAGLDRGSTDKLLELALTLVDAIDAELGRADADPLPAPAAAA